MLRNAGLSYGDYLEQLTYLIFLKMMHERTQPPFTMLPDYQPPPIPEDCDWPSLLARTARSWTPTTGTRWKPCPNSRARWG